MKKAAFRIATAASALVALLLAGGCAGQPEQNRGSKTRNSSATPQILSPAALACTPNGKTLFIACATANRVLEFDLLRRLVPGSFELPGSPSGLTLAADGKRLCVTR